jgi:RNA polymerase sigma-70 factor (ECF subfamily)
MADSESKSSAVVGSGTSDRLYRNARQGDASALDALFARQLPFLLRYARGRLPRWARTFADTADVVQDALLRTLRRLSRFEQRGQGALRAYLKQAVDNRLRDEYRRVRRHGVGEELDEAMRDTSASPIDDAVARETEARYLAALARLRAGDRELIVGHVELGYSNEQLAVMTGRRRVDAVRVALTRALQRLADEMARG